MRAAWAHVDAERTRGFGGREAVVLVVAAIGLSVMHFGGGEFVFLDWVAPATGVGPDALQLASLLHWVAFCVLGYVVVPVVALKLTGQRARDQYLSFEGTRRHLGVYLAFYVPVLIAVLAVSGMPSFQAIYPMYPDAGRSWTDLVVWELAYGVQFVALEFFFRGYLLRSLAPSLGHAAIFVMVVPYCMLHFQKTFIESLGSIIAGVVLGTMAMRWRSIWGGALLHWLVALTMDLASLIQKDQFPPGRFLP